MFNSNLESMGPVYQKGAIVGFSWEENILMAILPDKTNNTLDFTVALTIVTFIALYAVLSTDRNTQTKRLSYTASLLSSYFTRTMASATEPLGGDPTINLKS